MRAPPAIPVPVPGERIETRHAVRIVTSVNKRNGTVWVFYTVMSKAMGRTINHRCSIPIWRNMSRNAHTLET